MHLIPTNLAPLADVASRHEGKYATTGVELTVFPDRSEYRAAATDGKRLLVVSGPCPGGPAGADHFPHETIREAPNGATRAVIPAAAWRKTVREAEKAVGKLKVNGRPAGDVLKALAVSLSKEVTSFATTNAQKVVTHHENIDGRFPPYMDVIPKKAPLVLLRIDPALLAGVLDSAGSFTDEQTPGVDLEIHRNGHVVIRAEGNGQKAVGLCVGLDKPVVGGKPVEDDGPAEAPAPASTADETGGAKVKRLRAELAERDATIAELRAALAVAAVPAAGSADDSELAALRRQVAVLQKINAGLARERGLVGT